MKKISLLCSAVILACSVQYTFAEAHAYNDSPFRVLAVFTAVGCAGEMIPTDSDPESLPPPTSDNNQEWISSWSGKVMNDICHKEILEPHSSATYSYPWGTSDENVHFIEADKVPSKSNFIDDTMYQVTESGEQAHYCETEAGGLGSVHSSYVPCD
jgi:hypothetical protein